VSADNLVVQEIIRYLNMLKFYSNEELLEQFNTNLFGAMNVTTALLPHLRQRKSGTIAFTGSIFSFTTTPCVGPYVLSKHALAGLSTISLPVCLDLIFYSVRRNTPIRGRLFRYQSNLIRHWPF